MEGDNFLEWFGSTFIPVVEHLLTSGPVILFVDGHHSHLYLSLVKMAHEKGVHLFCLPPHTTHILQPLDVGVYGPLKQSWKRILKVYNMTTLAANVSRVFQVCRNPEEGI